jgi:dUTP pyrophosphatase
VIDEDYRGELGVLLFNLGNTAFEVKRGDRVAQLVLERISTPEVVEVESLDETVRGGGGYGSTGVAAPSKVDPPMAAAGTKRPLGENEAEKQAIAAQ